MLKAVPPATKPPVVEASTPDDNEDTSSVRVDIRAHVSSETGIYDDMPFPTYRPDHPVLPHNRANGLHWWTR